MNQVQKAVNYYRTGKFTEAEKGFKKLIKREPRDYYSLCYLAAIYQQQGKLDKCEQSLIKALKINPDNSAALNLYSDIKSQEGNFKEADRLLRKSLTCEGNLIATHVNLLKLCPKDTEVLDGAIECVDDSLDDESYAALAFAIGSSYDAQGDYKNAFEWFKLGNDRKFYTRDLYSHEAHKGYIDTLKHIFTAENIERAVGHQSDAPIFIVGMPRSGTTLVEQIISSHPEVTAGGELPYMTRLGNKTDFDQHLMQDMRQLGKKYLTSVGIRGRFTDKLPNNFHFIGLIKSIFPDAKIVHVNRNREDTMLSCWQANFTNGNLFTFNWKDLNDFYDDYLDLMSHWEGEVDYYDLSYEALIGNQEDVTRDLLDYLGLDWSDSCLSPESNGAKIKTASLIQARKPVNSNSIGRFENYREFLSTV